MVDQILSLKGASIWGPPLPHPFSMVQSDVKRFGIYYKLFEKSLPKVGSLKRSIAYSLILEYQFCACVMRISGIPQLQVIHMERLYDYK